MQTADKIHKRVRAVKPCSRAMLYIYFKRLGIKPVGARQRPQNYPDDAADRVLKHLGLEEPAPARIVSLKQLRSIRSRSLAGKGEQ